MILQRRESSDKNDVKLAIAYLKKFSNLRKMDFGLGTAISVVVFIGAIACLNLTDLIDRASWVSHTEEVLERLARVDLKKEETEANLRSFLLTGQSGFLKSYSDSERALETEVNTLSKLIADNSNQSARLQNLKPLLAAKLEGQRKAIELFKTEDAAAGVNSLAAPTLVKVDREVDAAINDLENHEHELMTERINNSTSAARRMALLIILGSLFSVLVIVIARRLVRSDLKGRALADQALKNSDERFKLLSRATNDAVWDWDLSTNQIWWNHGLERLFGYTDEDVQHDAQWWLAGIHPDDRSRIEADISETILNTRTTWTCEYRFRRKDGSYCFVFDRGFVQRDSEGQPVRVLGSIMDMTERKRFESELHERERQLKEAQELAHLGAWTFEYSSRTLEWSEEIYKVYGHKAGEVQPSLELFQRSIHAEDRLRVMTHLESQKKLVDGTSFEYRHLRGDGAIRILSCRCKVDFDQEGNPQTLRGTALDITEQKELEAQLIEASKKALESSRLKSEFLANMSHEIRTPMNGIIGMTNLLLETSLTTEQKDFSETVRASSDALLTIINDILDFSKIEAGKLDLEAIDFDVRSTIETTLDIVEPASRLKGLELLVDIDDAIPARLHGDGGRLRQVMLNLLSNAVKFTEHGEVMLRVRMGSWTEGRMKLHFDVRDTGLGITPEVQGRLFKAFVQADGSTVRRYGGTGLGLAISKSLVEKLGGEIGIESEFGAGSRFWFSAEFELAKETPLAVVPSNATLQKRRVLIHDENGSNRALLEKYLSSWEMDVQVADSAKSAIDKLFRAHESAQTFDLVILDHRAGSEEIRRALAHEPQLKGVRKLLMAPLGFAPSADTDWTVQLIYKPVKKSVLHTALLQALLPEGEILKAKVAQNVVQSTQFAGLRVLVVEDNPVNQKIVLAQLSKLNIHAEAVVNGSYVADALCNASEAFHLVFMDCQMPVMDGFQATQSIRLLPAPFATIPVIAMTANAMDGDRERCLAAGMDDYISKPFKVELLKSLLATWSAKVAHAPASETPSIKSIVSARAV